MSDSKKVVCKTCGNVNRLPNRELTKANCGSCKNSLLDTTPVELNDSNFDNFVVNSSIPVVVDFWAPWCGPCKMMTPVFKEVATKFPLTAVFAKVNTEAQQNLGAQYNIRSIPTLVVFQNGKEIARQSGALDAVRLEQWVSSFKGV